MEISHYFFGRVRRSFLLPEYTGEEEDEGEDFETADEHGEAQDPFAERRKVGPSEGWACMAKARATVADGGDGGAESCLHVQAFPHQDKDADEGYDKEEEDKGQGALQEL